MTRQRNVSATRKGLCCLYVLALGLSALSVPLQAQDVPSSAAGLQPASGPDRKGTSQTAPAPSVPTDKPTVSQPETSLPPQTLVDGPQGGPLPWVAPANPFFPGIHGLEEYLNPSGMSLSVGGWAVIRHGSPYVTGEWQSTDPSPFWDVDGLWTNGTRTLNYSATGPDNESTQAKVQYFGPNSQGFFYFNRFIHAEEHENFNNMRASALVPGTGPGSGQPVIAQDLNTGQNYPLRVNQYEAAYKFKLLGQPNKDDVWLNARINIWDQEEFGDIQANSTVHCFTARAGTGQQRSCHVLSQAQGIDWNTFEVTPVLEGRYGRVSLQYSHTLRVFSTHDQTVFDQYADGGANILQGTFPYSVTPNNLFNMDKIKLGIDVNDYNHIFAYGYYSLAEDSGAGVSREQGGVDLRWTNTAYKGLNFTTYFKNDNQSGNRPTALLTPDQRQGLTRLQQAAELFQLPYQIGLNRYTAGEKFSWRPWTGSCDSFLSHLVVTGGYEFEYLIRSNENWYFPSLDARPPNFAVSPTTPIFYQPNTTTHAFDIGVQVPWTDSIHTYARYKFKSIKDALYGYTPLNFAVNSSLPDNENIIEFGADWFPSQYFGAAAHQAFNFSSRSGNPLPRAGDPVLVNMSPGDVLNFGEQSYATDLVFWYRPTDKLTLSANTDYFSNQIKQNITIGDDSDTSFTGSGATFATFAPYTSRWVYGGTAVEFGGGITYLYSAKLRLTADYEVTFGKDLVNGGTVVGLGTPVVNNFIPLGTYSKVRNVVQQASAGLDYKPRERMTMYVRYQYINFQDLVDSPNGGNLNMILAGLSYKW